MDESFHAPFKQATRIKRLPASATFEATERAHARAANAALLRRLRGVSWREPRTGKSVLCTHASGCSFGSPPGFHRCGKLRTTFRCEVELSLWFLGSAWFCRGSRRFTLSLSRGPCFCCFKLAFQLGQFVPTFLHASFEPSDLFLETFLLFHMR